MIRKTLAALGITLLCLATVGFAADTDTTQEQQEEIDKLQQEVKDLKKRVSKNEMKTGLDRINFTGDFRFEANSFDMTFDDYYDGMALQRMLVDTLFYFGATGMPPQSPEDVGNLIRENYGDYLYDREATYPGCVSGYEINPDGTLTGFDGRIMDRVFGGSEFSEGNILAAAQRADDARAVIEYVHETTTHVISSVDSVGTTSCPPVTP